MGIEGAIILVSALTGVDAALLDSICWVESHHRVSAYVHQDGGSPSYGLCQVKLETARGLGFAGRRDQLMDASWNLLYASLYLKHLLRRYGGDRRKAVSAYNAGRTIKGNRPYVDRVMGRVNELRKRQLLPLH